MATWTTTIQATESETTTSIKITVDGVPEGATGITVDESAKTVTIPTSLLGTSNVTISTESATVTGETVGEYSTDDTSKFKLSVDLSVSALRADQKVVSTAAAWTLSGTTATYAQTVKPKYEKTNDYTITYVEDGDGEGTSETLATITNVTGTPNAPTAEGVILVPQNIFGTDTIVLDDKGNNYTLQDPTYTQGATEYAWVANGNTKGSFKYQSTTAKNYTLAQDAKSITYTEPQTTELATISGLADTATAAALSTPGASGAITVQGTALKDGDVTLTNADGSNFTLALGTLSNTQNGTVTYEVTYPEDSGKYTATYTKKTADNYTASGTKITHITTDDETLATVTGLAVGSGVTVEGTVITVPEAAFDKTNGNEVAVDEGKGTYTLTTAVKAPEATGDKAFAFNSDKAIEYQQPMTAGAVVSEDKSKITYKKAYNDVLATITGLKDQQGLSTAGSDLATAVTIDANNVITIKEAALNGKAATLDTTGDYTLALDKLTAATSIIKSEYAVSGVTGGTATIQQTDTVKYKVADNAKSIEYDAETGFTATPTEVAKITGLLTSATSGVEVAATADATSKKYDVTVHLAALTGGGGATLSNTDKFVLKLANDTANIDAYKWDTTTTSGTAVYQSYKKSNYSVTEGKTIKREATPVAVTGTETPLATITNVVASAAADNFTVDEENKVITVKAAALTTSTSAISGTGNYKIAVDNSGKLSDGNTDAKTTGSPKFVAGTGDDAGKAIYQRIDTVKYKANDAGTQIEYKSDGYELDAVPLAKVSGVKTDATGFAGLEFGTGDNAKQITVKSAALDKKEVTVEGEGYSIVALETQTPVVTYVWSVKDGKATYTKVETVNYVYDDGKILYSETGTETAFHTDTKLAEITGVNAELNGKTSAEIAAFFTVDNTASSEKITVKAGALTTSDVSITNPTAAKYTLALDANTASAVNEWNYDGTTGTTAHYQTVTKSNYAIGTGTNEGKIIYSATETEVTDAARKKDRVNLITFTGIKEGLEPTALQEAFNIGTTADTTDGKKTVTVKNAALGTSAIELTNGSSTYKVALEEQTPTLSNQWQVSTPAATNVTTATYKSISTVNFRAKSGSKTEIEYSGTGFSTPTELFSISGIKKIKDDGETYQPSAITEITVKGNVVTLNKAALNGKNVKLEGEGYTLAIGADVAYIGKKSDGTTAVENEWQGSGSGEAQYIQPVVTNYTLGEGSKTINYSEEAIAADPVVLATIKGLSTKNTSAEDLAKMFVVTPGENQKYTIKLKGSAITGSTYITSQNGKDITNGESGAGSTYKDTTITLDLYTDDSDPDYVVNDIAGNTKKWSFNGTKATYDSVKSPTYTFAKTVEGGTTAAEGNNTIQITGGKGNTNTLTNIITVNGINAAYDTTKNPFAIDEDGKKVTVAAAALGTSTLTLENKGNTKYTLAIDGTGVITYGKHEAGKESAAPTWLVKGGVATYYTADSFDAEKEWGYKIVDNDAAKKTITYVAPTLTKGATPTITVSGIANIAPDATGTVPGLTYDSGNKTVTVSYDALAKKNVTISSKANDVKLAISATDFTAYGADSDAEFKIYTTTTTPAAATGGDPLLDGSGEETESATSTSDIKAEDITNGGVLTVKQSIKKGYTISADSGAIFFTSKVNGDTVTLANVTGLNKAAVKGTDYTIDETTGKITLLTNKALAEKAVKVTTGHYTLDFDPSGSVTKAKTDTDAHWVLDKAGTTATYQLKTSAGYTLSDDGKSIAYAKDPTYEVYTKISGLSSNLRATIDATITGLTKPTEETIKAVADNVTAIEAARAAAIAALPATATDAERTAAGDKAAADKLAELLKIAQDNYQVAYDDAFATKLAYYFTIGTADADKPKPITIDAAAFGSSNITIKNSKGHSYSLAVPAEGISTEAPTESSGWYVNGASLSIQTNTGAYYELDEKAEKITYHKAATAKGSKPAVTISGLKAGLTVGTDGEIAGITKATADGKTTITLSASVLNDKTVKISAGSDKADYKLALSDTTDAVTKSTVANTWEYASSTLSLTQGQTEGYVLSDDGTTATYYNGKTGAKVVAKIKGLAKAPTISTTTRENDTVDDITINSDHKIITIENEELLGSSVEFVGKSDYTLAVGSSINTDVEPTYDWVVDEKKKTATYQMKFTADMYVVENGKIVKKTATTADPATVDLITIKGLKTVSGTKTEAAATDDATATAAAVEIKDGVVYLKADALGTAKVTATGSYKLALYEAPETSPTDDDKAAEVNQDKTATGNDWLIKGTTATYEDVYKEAYTLSDKGDSVTYTAAKKVDNKQSATITLSNLKSGVTASDIDYNELTKTITLGANAIGTNPKKPTTVSSGYTLAIDPTLVSAQTTSASVYKGNSVTYTVEQSAGYTLANNAIAITYAKPVTAKLVTISGLAKFLTQEQITAGVNVDATAYQSDNTKPITVSVSADVLKQTLNKAGGTELTTPILSKSVKVTAGKDLDGKTKPTVTLELSDTQATDNIWYLDGANAKYINAYTTAHYDLDATKTKLTYVATAKPTLDATAEITVTGLDKKLAKSETYKTLNLGSAIVASDSNSDSINDTITIDTSVLDKKSTITASGAAQLANGGYTLDFKSGGETLHKAEDAEATWTLGKKAVLKQDQAQGYTLSIDGKTITYQSAAKTGRNAVTVASINGLADKNTVVETSGTNHDIIELTKTQLTNKVTVDSIGYTFKFDDTYSGTSDTAKEMNTITGGKNIDKIEAGGDYLNITTAAGNDVIKATGKNNIINGGKGDDYIEVTGGSNNIITYANGDGNDIIKGIGATDQINLAVFTKAELEKVDKKTEAPVNYVTSETVNGDTVLTLVKNKKTVGTITLKDTASLSNVKLYAKDGKEFSYEITPTAVSTASGSSGFIGSGNVADEFYSNNYATGSNLGDIISGDSNFSVGDIETGNATDLAKNNTPIITGSNKK